MWSLKTVAACAVYFAMGTSAIEFPFEAPSFYKSKTCAEKLFGTWDCQVNFPDGLPYIAEVQRILGIFGNAGAQVDGKLKQTWVWAALQTPKVTNTFPALGLPQELVRTHGAIQRDNQRVQYPPWLGLQISDAETNQATFEGSCNEPSLVYRYLNYISGGDRADIFPYLGYCIDYFTSFCACKVKRKKSYFGGSSSSLVQSASEFVCNFPDVQNTSWNAIPYLKYQHFAWDGTVSGDTATLTSVGVFAPPNDCFEIFCRQPFLDAAAGGDDLKIISDFLDSKAANSNFCANQCLFPNYSWRAYATCKRQSNTGFV